ncbi:MAG: hypothetical protein SFU86_22145 [Pirellulaceae bacterium]|nr:hypothetical protein [Pirellulaceae bacterium]
MHPHLGCCRWATVSAVLIAVLHGAARGDTFILTSGGRVEGEWLNREEQPVAEYLVRTSAGLTITLPLTQVRQAIRNSGSAAEYRQRAPLAADTVEGQWELAEWCKSRGLFEERRTHLARILALDPNHQGARNALGQRFLAGEWITPQDFRRREGYEYYRGKWRTPQEIEILEACARTEQAEKDWAIKLRRYRADLAGERAKLGYESIASIHDPHAVKSLAELFAREPARKVKMLYADVLAQINTADATAVLVQRTLSDPDEEIFHYCLDRLVAAKPPRLADPFVEALKDPANARVNRAAMALGRIGDQSTISPLIDALITTHAQVIQGQGPAGPGVIGTTTGFSDRGTVMKQNDGPKVQISRVQNQHVLDALAKLAGTSFGFDQRAWRFWHAQEKQAAAAAQTLGDARRQ